MLDLSRARDRMVDVQIARRGVRDPRVLDAMRRVPREAFVESVFEEFAYEDGPLPIGEHAIERHLSPGNFARQRFRKLGYDNIDLRVGDGTRRVARGRAV